MKKNIAELNVVKAVAILAVLLIHVTANPRLLVPWGSMTAPFYMIANQLSMFAVPVFILINGLVLFYRYHDDWSFSQALAFYKKRIKYIVIPYLIWSAIYYFFGQMLSHQPLQFDLSMYAELLLWGDSSYHLYFMSIIIQFYLVFPVLMTLVRKLRFKAYHMVLLGLLVQGVFYYIHNWVNDFEHAASLMPNYFIVFGVGAAIGMSYSTFAEQAKQLWWTFGLTILIGFVYMLMLVSAYNEGTLYWQPAYVILYNLYAVLAGISMIWIGKIVTERANRLTKWILSLGAASFGIYLVHPAFLSAWKTVFNPTPQHPYYHVFNLVTMLIVIAVPWLVVLVSKKVKMSWLVWGR